MLVTNKFNRRFNLVPTTTTMEKKIRPVNVLLVEDNPGDVRLTQEAFKEAKISIKLDVTMDGVDAIKFLRKEAEYSEAFANPYRAAFRGYVDDVIMPEQTRDALIKAFKMLENKAVKLPKKKHGNLPL